MTKKPYIVAKPAECLGGDSDLWLLKRWWCGDLDLDLEWRPPGDLETLSLMGDLLGDLLPLISLSLCCSLAFNSAWFLTMNISCCSFNFCCLASSSCRCIAWTRTCSNQVWSLTHIYSVDFSQSRIGSKKCVFNKRTIKVCVSCS